MSEQKADTPRQRVYKFLQLPYHVQYRRAQALGLVEPQDVETKFRSSDEQLLWTKRAEAKGVVNQLFEPAAAPPVQPPTTELSIEDLHEALRRYGRHLSGCAALEEAGEQLACSCGFGRIEVRL